MPEVPDSQTADRQVCRALVLAYDVSDDAVVAAEILAEDTVDGVDVRVIGGAAVLDHPLLASLVVLVIPMQILNHAARVHLYKRN